MKIFIGICMSNMFIIIWWNTSVYSIMLKLYHPKKDYKATYFVFIHSGKKNGIFGDCANEYFKKLQVMQNKLLKLLSNNDQRLSTNELHQQLSLLKVVDIHTVIVLSYIDINECRCPTLFSSNYHVREAGYEPRPNDCLRVPMARTDIGQSSSKIKGLSTGLTVIVYKSFRTTITKHLMEIY